MTIENMMTIFGAIVGSSLTVSVIHLIAGRLRFDRRSDVVKAWKDESDVADKLWQDSLNEQISIGSEAARTKIAFSHAIRVNLNRRISYEIVPSGVWSQVTAIVLVFFTLFFAGPLLLYTHFTEVGGRGASILTLLFGITLCIMGLALLTICLFQEFYRSKARSIVIEVLSGKIIGKNIFSIVDGKSAKAFSGKRIPHIRRSILGTDISANFDAFLTKSFQIKTLTGN